MTYDPERRVGYESRKTYAKRIQEGFFDKYMQGEGIELAPTGYEEDIETILPTAIPIDLDTPAYNRYELPVSDESQDYIYSSHVLEHIDDYQRAIRAWYRALKVGGHIIIYAPHRDLYEKKLTIPTSLHNPDHKRAYTPASLLREIEESLEINSYRIRLLRDNDDGYDYSLDEAVHCVGECQIELVIQKIKKPDWIVK
jgi:SAM-dependent methyltransferase